MGGLFRPSQSSVIFKRNLYDELSETFFQIQKNVLEQRNFGEFVERFFNKKIVSLLRFR